jgi:CubicO group peptidase (beta-lactamase class C family)
MTARVIDNSVEMNLGGGRVRLSVGRGRGRGRVGAAGCGGFSQERLGRMHEVMAGFVARGEVPGLVTLVSRHGETHVDAMGTLAAGGSGGPVRRDTIFRIASLSKPVAAVAAMILIEECRLRLDDPLDRLLPELAGRRVLRSIGGALDDTVPAHRPLTLRDLLTFRMGFGVVMEPPGTHPIQRAISELGLPDGPPQPATMPEPDEWMRRLGTLPLIHQPGERWMYHTASDVLGVLVARAAGQPLGEFLRERIFEPLGMRDTAFSVPASKLDRFATGYRPRPDGASGLEVFDPAAGGQWSRPPAFPAAGGGLVSTAPDFLAFARMLLDLGAISGGTNDGERLLSRAAVETLTTDQLTAAQKAASTFVPGFFDRRGWGFGVAVVTRRDDLALHPGSYGWDGGFGTSWYSDPHEDLIGILFTQVSWTSPNPPPVCRDFWTLACQAIDDGF